MGPKSFFRSSFYQNNYSDFRRTTRPSLNTENVFKSILVCALFVSENVPFFCDRRGPISTREAEFIHIPRDSSRTLSK